MGIFFQNNYKSQTILLVSNISKLFRKLTTRVYETRFYYSKSILKDSISVYWQTWGEVKYPRRNWVFKTRFPVHHLLPFFFLFSPPSAFPLPSSKPPKTQDSTSFFIYIYFSKSQTQITICKNPNPKIIPCLTSLFHIAPPPRLLYFHHCRHRWSLSLLATGHGSQRQPPSIQAPFHNLNLQNPPCSFSTR